MSNTTTDNLTGIYEGVLKQFPSYISPGIKSVVVGSREYSVFGDPASDENGMRSLGNFVFTGAVVAKEALGSSANTAKILCWVRSSIRYMCDTHVTGSTTCIDRRKWGCEWQSAWWATKMALGAKLIWTELAEAEKEGVERVVTAECARFIGVPARTGLFRDTKAEENAWDSEILATALAMFPKHPLNAEWREVLWDYVLNSLSAPQDLTDTRLVNGRPLNQQVYTVNLHSDFTLENHGPYHFCYMASPMQSLCWGYYAQLSSGLNVADDYFHNLRNLWMRIRSTFLDTRFAYISGQDWARYTYGMYFIVPVLALMARLHQDREAHSMEIARLEMLAAEQNLNGDGSFFGVRVTHGQMFGQWAKYETDCYANLALTYLLSRSLPSPPLPYKPSELPKHIVGRHCSPESSLCYSRTDRFFASFSWDSIEGPYPLLLFIPNGMDDAAEWSRNNLLGMVAVSHDPDKTLMQRRMRQTSEGFSIEGKIMYRDKGGFVLDHDLRVELLERDSVMVIENRFVARRNLLVGHSCGMRFCIANDLFNKYTRCIHSALGEMNLEFKPKKSGKLLRKLDASARRLGFSPLSKRRFLKGDWLNIDDRLGLIACNGISEFSITQSCFRNAPWGSIHFDEIKLAEKAFRRASTGEVISKARYLLVAGDRLRTRELSLRQEDYSFVKLRPNEQIS